METMRCILRSIEQGDFENLKKLYTNEAVRLYLGGTCGESEFTKKFNDIYETSRERVYWIISIKENAEFVGLISLDPHHDSDNLEVSYQLLPEFWGRGIATEVLNKVIEYTFEQLTIPVLLAETQMKNSASRKLLEKVGMGLVKEVERFGKKQGIYEIRNSQLLVETI